MKVRIDPAIFAAIRLERGLTYDEIVERSGGAFQVYGLKYLVNGRTNLISEERARLLARILHCEVEDLLAADFVRATCIPVGLALLVKNLYRESREDIYTVYQHLMQTRLQDSSFLNLTMQAGMLREVLTRPALEEEPAKKVHLALELITTKFAPSLALSSSTIGADFSQLEWLVQKIRLLGDTFTPQHTVLLFVYVLVLFESVFLEECVASVMQLAGERWREVTDQYFMLTTLMEKLKGRYLDFVLNAHSRFSLDEPYPMEIADLYFQDTLLLVLCCGACADHFADDLMASRYVNRKSLNAVLRRVLGTARDVFNLAVTEEQLVDRYLTRFGQRYLTYRTFRRAISGDSSTVGSKVTLDPNSLILGAMFNQWNT